MHPESYLLEVHIFFERKQSIKGGHMDNIVFGEKNALHSMKLRKRYLSSVNILYFRPVFRFQKTAIDGNVDRRFLLL